jgi:hypothetical protein
LRADAGGRFRDVGVGGLALEAQTTLATPRVSIQGAFRKEGFVLKAISNWQ